MWEIEQLNADQLRTMFGVERGSLSTPGFPGSERDSEGEERWPADQVWQWVASRQPVAAAITPLRYWARGEAVYLQAREIPGGVAQDWSVHGVVLRVVWPTVEESASAAVAEAAANLAPRVPTVIKVRHDFGIWGPSLAVHDDAGIRLDDDEPVWPELALVLGGRAPYWPAGLREASSMLQWHPGIPPAEVAAAVEIDPAPVLRLAATLPTTDTAHAVLLELVQHVQYRASEYAEHTIQTVTEDPKVAAWVELAATSLPVPAPAELDDVVLRDGWLTVASRPDTLAHQSVVQALRYGHTAALPYTSAEYIDPTTGLGAEWAARLEPTSPYAGFEVLYGHLEPGGEDTITDYLTDPATDAPALRLASGKLLAAVPHRLPAVSPLAAVTLGTPIWVRLDDGTVHLAPRRDAPGISWGYKGSGTNTLALLIAQLLDDITAPAATNLRGGGAGLERLLQTNWADGTTLTRAELEAARTGKR